MNEILFEVWRGNVLESAHTGRYAVVRGGKVVGRSGNVDAITFLRSCAKPFQAVTVLESGAVDKYGLAPDEVAVICGSHYGEDVHVRAASSILRKAGLRPSHLQCGAHAPLSVEASRRLARAGKGPTALHNNCSGKHAGMVAAAKAMGAPVATYLDPAHPLQRANRRTVARFAGVRESAMKLATDGCSAPTFGLPLTAIARAFAALGADPTGREVAAAMSHHPHMIGHPCEELMKAAPGALVGKVGAEGVYGACVPGRGLGFAVKIDDGSTRPLLAVVVALLGRFAALRLDALVKTELKNHAGRTVGRLRTRV